jgi:hypothetical protein
MAKKTVVMKESAFSEELIERIQDDAQFLEHYLLNDTKGLDEFTCNATVSYVEELLGMMPEELMPLVVTLRKVRAKQVAKAA